jgi:hypothetical protein
MSNVQGYFPVVLSVYISLVGLDLGSATSVLALERRRVIDFLKEKIEPKILANELMKDNKTTYEAAVLPREVYFDRGPNKFKYRLSGGGEQVME